MNKKDSLPSKNKAEFLFFVVLKSKIRCLLFWNVDTSENNLPFKKIK